MILVVQRYTPADDTRRQEIETCLATNSKSGLFSHVEAVDGDLKAWTIGELFGLCHEKFPGEVCVVANSDIIFDQSCEQAEQLLEEARLLALTRWENESSPRMLGHFEDDRFYSGTQDSWIFRGGSLPPIEIEIPLGKIACDNVLVGWAVMNGIWVADPALSLRTYHVHQEKRRPEREAVYGYYGYPELTTLRLSRHVLCHRADRESFHHLCKFN